MKFLRRHWYEVSVGIALVIFACLALFWNNLSVLQRLSLANLGVIFLHFFEEFGFPGGFPKLANAVLYPSADAPADRYPLNQNSVMIGNWIFAILFYIPPIFFPNLIWLGLMPILFGAVGQSISHLIVNNIAMRTWYNGGLATTVFGHIPIVVLYVTYVQQRGLATVWDYVIAVIYAVAAYALFFRRLIFALGDKNSPYPFDGVEMRRFDRLNRKPLKH
jgi:hypothetical protein